MHIVRDEKLAEWLMTGEISGLNGEEEEQSELRRLLSNYGPDMSCHVSEFYSPKRVTDMADRMKLIPGLALDLTTCDPDDGMPWDFEIKEKRDKVRCLSRHASHC